MKAALLHNLPKYDLYEGAEFEIIDFNEDGTVDVEDATGSEYNFLRSQITIEQ